MPTLPADTAGAAAHLVVEDLTAGYGGVPVVEDVSLTVGRGETMVLLGRSGRDLPAERDWMQATGCC